MDMHIKIEEDKIVTSLYAKPLALHFYTPSHSFHAPGLLSAFISGMTLGIFQLCSGKDDMDQELTVFMRRLRERGHKLDGITPKVSRAIKNAQKYLARSDE